MIKPKIQSIRYHVDFIDKAQIGGTPIDWLQKQASPGMILLAHADDGLIWGKATQSGFDLPVAYDGEIKQPDFRNETILFARLFDDMREIFLWRFDEMRWRARIVRDQVSGDEGGEEGHYFDRHQIVNGTNVKKIVDDFRWVEEGSEGLYHAPPMETDVAAWQSCHPLRLRVRHYLNKDDDGWQRIGFSRLTGLWADTNSLNTKASLNIEEAA